MSLRSKNLFTICLSALLVFYQPSPTTKGQTVDSATQNEVIVLPELKDSEAVEYLDTLKNTSRKYSTAIEKSKENAKIAAKQADKSTKQNKEILQQQRVIDSLQKLRDHKVLVNAKEEDEIIHSRDTIIYRDKKGGIKNWGIWDMFKRCK